MLKSLRLKYYKCFVDTEEIQIKPITLLLGKNNSGKSSILKVFSFLEKALTKGSMSTLAISPADNIRMGDTLLDMFHRRELVELGFITKFSDGMKYSIYLLSSNGNIQPYKMELEKPGMESITRTDQKLYQEFAGLFPKEYAGAFGDATMFQVMHIGPLRKTAPAIIPRSSATDSKYVGYYGERAYGILLNSFLNSSNLFKNVSNWFKDNMDGLCLDFAPIDVVGSNYILNIVNDSVPVNIVDGGLGIAQLLPIITQTFIENHNTIIPIEQPALHLHPAAHAAVASRLAESAKSNDVYYIVESHSKNFLLGLRLDAITPDTKFNVDDAAIYYISNDELPSTLKEIRINKNGSLTYWPTGVFGEDADLMDQIIELQ